LAAILRFMTVEGLALRPSTVGDVDFAHRLEQALAPFDWTDVEWLRPMLLELWTPDHQDTGSEMAERAIRSSATHRQRMLLADLLTVLRAGGLQLDAREPLAPANALRWYAALLAHAPHWADDPLATALIGRLLVAWSTLDSSSRAFSPLESRSSGAPDVNVSPARAMVSQLGEPAVAVLAALEELPPGEGHRSAAAIPTECAGLFFLLRAIRDLRLPHLVARTAFPIAEPDENGIEPLSALLLGIGDGLAGPLDHEERRSDPGLRLFANLPDEYESTAVAQVWDRVPPVGHEQFQQALFATLAGQRLFDRATLRLERHSFHGGEVLLGGLAGTALWPFGCAFPHPVSIETVIREWVDAIEREMGIRPQVLVGPFLTHDTEPFARTLETSVRSISGDSPEAAPSVTDIEVLMPGSPGLLDARLTLALTGLSLVRAWARWLPRFAEATTPYLLHNFIRRQGEIFVTPDTIVIETDPGPLDVLLDMAGYRAEMEQVAWLGGRTVRFKS
jgi:hypothetical protein